MSPVSGCTRALQAASLGALLLAALAPRAAAYDVCRSPDTGAVGTVTGDMATSGFAWECTGIVDGVGDGEPGCGDRFEIAPSDRVTVTGTLCSAEEPASRVWQVEGRLDLDPGAPVTMHRTGLTHFRTGSDGIWRGFELAAGAVPPAIANRRWSGSALVASTAHLALQYGDPGDGEGSGLPWSACSAPGCADASPAETVGPGTHLYFDFETLASAAQASGGAADPALDVPFYEPGAYLEVTSVVDGEGDGGLDTIVVRLPTTGPGYGAQHFGADGTAVPIPGGPGEGRCEECLQEMATQTRRGDAEGETKVDTSGFHLRNAIGEVEAWAVDSVARVVCDAERSGTDCLEGETRFELRVSDAAFDSDREFEGFLACLPTDQESFALSSERWCGRITGSFDARDPDGDGDPEDVLTVLHDPRGWVEPGQVLNVYYFRPVAGQKVVPFNFHTVDGHYEHTVHARTGSHFGRTSGACAERPCLKAIRWRRPGPQRYAAELSALWLESPDQLAVDAMLFEHGGPIDGEQGGVKYLVLGQLREPIEGVSRVDLSRIHCRFPSSRTDESERSAGTVYGHGCIRLVTGDESGNGAQADVWRGFAARKIRCEGTAQCFLWQAGHYGCQPGRPALQDLYAAHARDWVDDRIPWNLEQIEFQGLYEASCPAAMDRHYSSGHVAGSPLILRARGLESVADPDDFHTEITSGVVFGCNDGLLPCIVGNKSDGEGVHLTDLLVDGSHTIPAGLSYGAQTGFEARRSGMRLPGVEACQPLRGFVTRGLSEGFLNRGTGSCGEGSRLDVADNVVLGYAANGGKALYSMRHGPPPETLELRRNVFACAEGAEGCRLFDTRIEEPPGSIERLTLDDTLLLRPGASGSALRLLRLREELFAPESIRIGPNVHSNAGLVCESFPGSEAFLDPAACEPLEALAAAGDETAAGANGGSLAPPGPALTGIPLGGVAALATRSSAALGPACEGEEGGCRPEDALPLWAGPFGRAWPFAAATVDPLPVFQRGGPAAGTVPALLRDRLPECMNGVDDDGDGLVDHTEDPGCASVSDLSERSPTLACDDGADNDGDGAVDLADPGCGGSPGWIEGPDCQNGVDDDGDGRVDFDGGVSAGLPPADRTASDPECDSASTAHEWSSGSRRVVCGLGFELVGLLPAVMGLRRLRRRAAGPPA